MTLFENFVGGILIGVLIDIPLYSLYIYPNPAVWMVGVVGYTGIAYVTGKILTSISLNKNITPTIVGIGAVAILNRSNR